MDYPLYGIIPFSVIFFWFITIKMKTDGGCLLLTFICIKDIQFAIENHPRSLKLENISTSYDEQRNKKNKIFRNL